MSDFGKILEEWERLGHEKTRDPRKINQTKKESPAERSRRILEEAMLRGADAVDKDVQEQPVRPLTKAEIAAMSVEAVLDLHGLTASDAESSLSAFFRDAAARSLKKVLVIHGKGLHSEDAPVLGKTVRRFLETSPLAGRHGWADRKSGGNGAVWVLIRENGQRSR